MKTVRRVCSVILMLFGGLYAFGGIVGLWVDLTTRDADNWLEVFVIMLLIFPSQRRAYSGAVRQ